MPRHRKPPNRRSALYAAIVVVAAVFATVIGFSSGGSDTSPRSADRPSGTSPAPSRSAVTSPVETTASLSPARPTSAAPRATSSATRRATPEPTPSARARPSSRSTGLGTQDGSLGSLDRKVRNQPVRIRIPSLGVDASVLPAGVDATGALQVPDNVIQAAWFQGGAAPGDRGTAIIAAHVDYNGALGLFNQLRSLKPGARIEVVDVGGTVRVFRAVKGSLAPKNDPSTVQSLGASSAARGKPRLALITCGGELDPAARSYRDNYVLLADG